MPKSPLTNTPIKSLEERFMVFVEKTDSCWLWRGRMSPNGYGNTRIAGKSIGAHRLSYELFIGTIPPGQVIDHACHDSQLCLGGWECQHRSCVNPSHLIAMTQQENLARSSLTTVGQIICRNGLHNFEGDNILIENSGVRRCKACYEAKQRRRYAKKST